MNRTLPAITILGLAAWGFTVLPAQGPTDRTDPVEPGPIESAEQQQARTRRVWVTGPAEQPMGPISLDGRILTYTDWFSGDLATLDLTTGEKRRLTGSPKLNGRTDYAEASAPSPDGSRIAYMWNDGDLRLIDATGGEPRTLLKGDYPSPSGWSPDGSTIAVVAERPDGTVHLMLVSPDNGDVRSLKSFGWRWPNGPAFSPDGRFLAYDFEPADGETDRDIYVIATDATRETIAVQTSSRDRFWGWTPDGNLLYQTPGDDQVPALWLQPMDDGRPVGQPRLVKTGLWRVQPLGSTRDGRFFYVVGAARSEIVVAYAGPDGLPSEQTIRPSDGYTPNGGSPKWSPDGRSVAFIAQTGPNAQGRSIIIASLESGERRELPLPKGVNGPQDLEWIPDGGALSLLATDIRVRDRAVFRVDAQTGELETLVSVRQATNETEWSPDGRTLYYAERQWPAASIITRRMDTAAVDTIHFTNEEGQKPGDFALSPDGRLLAMDDMNFRQWIRLMPATGGTPRELVTAADGERIGLVSWSADGSWLVYRRTHPSGRETLWWIPVDGGEAKPYPTAFQDVGSIEYSPDGRRIAMNVSEGAGEVWVLENIPGVSAAASGSGSER